MVTKKLKCWNKVYNYGDKDSEGRKSVADGWEKKGSFTNASLKPLVDVRKVGGSDSGFILETFDISSNRKFKERFDKRNDAVRRAKEIMKKHDKC